MKAAVIAIGDELLIGQVTDTNSGELAKIMGEKGWELSSVRVVHDEAGAIRSALEAAFAEADVVLTTGGLGPTKDDITKNVLCECFGGKLVRDPAVSENIREIFAKRGIEMNALTADQALVPECCRVIQNRLGTAPIMWFEREGKILVSMPGVPFETLGMFRSEVFPALLSRFPQENHIEHRTAVFADLTESKIAMELASWEANLPEYIHLAYLPKPGLMRLRLDGRHTDAKLLKTEIDRLHGELTARFPENLVADADVSPAEALIQGLRRRGFTVATAESCTGGTVASRITAVAGCSDVMKGGVVAYSNDVKSRLLGVPEELIAAHGAVSEPVARAMAEGVCRATGATCSVATTGIAGPSGGTPEKPVGTVWLGICIAGQTTAFCRRFPGNRDRVVDRAATTALTSLLLALNTN